MVESGNLRLTHKPIYLTQEVVNSVQNTHGYKLNADVLKDLATGHDAIIKNNPMTRLRMGLHKAADMPFYFSKGLTGNKNSNFFEFLQMGTFPYLTGSLTMILLYNLANTKYATQKDRFLSAKTGRKFAAGVVLFGVFKQLGNFLFNFPTKLKTGIDLNLPVRQVKHEFPDYPGDPELTSVEYHRAFESRDFARHDLLYKWGEKKGDRHTYFDMVARKIGRDNESTSPDQEVLPKIKEVISKATAAKSIGCYLWAAVGVAIASQESFGEIGQNWKMKTWGKRLKDLVPETREAFRRGVKDFYRGSKSHPYMGKALLGIATFWTLFGNYMITRTIKFNHEEKNNQVIDTNREYEAH